MASVGHLAVGLCLGRWLLRGPSPKTEWWGMGAFACAALLPDADVIAFALRIPYSAPWGHRGTSHSLAIGLLIFAPIQPLPVAPIGFGLLSDRGLHVLLSEAIAFLPLWVYALWPRTRA